jgi:hypothetical protein
MRSVIKFAVAAAAAMAMANVANAATATFVNPGPAGGYGYSGLGGGSATNYTASGDGSGASVQAIGNGWATLLASNLTFTRIYDSGPGGATYNDINAAGLPTSIDSLWKDGIASVSLRATFAGDGQWVGTRTASGLTTQVEPPISGTQLSGNGKFINVKSGFTSIAASNPFPFLLNTGLPSPSGSQTFEFVRSSNGSTVGQSSDPTLNASGRDQMISFLVTGDNFQPGEFYYAIFFEDRPPGGDYDYNDMALLFRGAAGGPVIPLPSAAMMGLALMGGMGIARVRR